MIPAYKKTLEIKGRTFDLVQKRTSHAVAVYQSGDLYLRMGVDPFIEKEIVNHKNFEMYGFPIAGLVEEGTIDGKRYYIEASLGTELLGDVFWQDTQLYGSITEQHFQQFMKITDKFAQAQLRSLQKTNYWHDFSRDNHIDALFEEFPELNEKINMAVEKSKLKLGIFPGVWSHDDLNPYNLLENGVVDLEWVMIAPVGLDLVANISLTFFVPPHGNYESLRRYRFSTGQLRQYFDQFNKLYLRNGVSSLENIVNDMLFYRAARSLVGMKDAPKIQKWRYI